MVSGTDIGVAKHANDCYVNAQASMYLGPELQVILSTPVPGATERVILMYEDGAGEALVDMIENDVPFDTTIDQLPENMLAVEIDQRGLVLLIAQSEVTAATIDDGTGTLTLQTRQQLLDAARTALHLTGYSTP